MGSPFSERYRYLAYGTSAAVGCGVCSFFLQERVSPFYACGLGNLAATTSLFAFSFAANNSCVYDAYWPVAPIPIAAYWLSINPKPSIAAYVSFGLLAAWALRYLGLEDPSTKVEHEDWRYAVIRAKAGALYWPISFFSFHLTPTLVVFQALSPLYALLSGTTGSLVMKDKNLFLASAATAAGAIALQWAADNQLARFRKSHTQGDVLETGVWAYSRHPNYFGEFLFWTGVLGMGLSSAGIERWMLLSVPTLFSFFRFASVPLMDDRMLQRRPAYAATIRRVSAFVPWFRSGGL